MNATHLRMAEPMIVADDEPEPEPHADMCWGTLAVALMLLAIAVAWTENWYLTVPVDAVLLWNMHQVLKHAL